MRFFNRVKNILEAATQASEKAKQMGLKGDGHGDWYDKSGKLVAKTIGGQLKFFGGKSAGSPMDPADLAPKPVEKPKEQPKQQTSQPKEGEKGDSGPITIGFVAIRSGNALKLVDRLEFSRANFTVDKTWGKA